MTKILINVSGGDIYVGIKSPSKTEITQTYYSFYNWKGCNTELYYGSPNFAYFQTNKKNLDLYCKNIAEHRLWLRDGKTHLDVKIDALAQEIRASWVEEKFPLERQLV